MTTIEFSIPTWMIVLYMAIVTAGALTKFVTWILDRRINRLGEIHEKVRGEYEDLRRKLIHERPESCFDPEPDTDPQTDRFRE